MILVVASVSYGCIFPEVTPAPTATPAPGSNVDAASLQGSKNAVFGAAAALDVGDSRMFLSLLTDSLNAQLGSDFNASDPAFATLSAGFKGAKLTEGHGGILFYEMTIGDQIVSFYTIQEGDEWKIGGL